MTSYTNNTMYTNNCTNTENSERPYDVKMINGKITKVPNNRCVYYPDKNNKYTKHNELNYNNFSQNHIQSYNSGYVGGDTVNKLNILPNIFTIK